MRLDEEMGSMSPIFETTILTMSPNCNNDLKTYQGTIRIQYINFPKYRIQVGCARFRSLSKNRGDFDGKHIQGKVSVERNFGLEIHNFDRDPSLTLLRTSFLS